MWDQIILSSIMSNKASWRLLFYRTCSFFLRIFLFAIFIKSLIIISAKVFRILINKSHCLFDLRYYHCLFHMPVLAIFFSLLNLLHLNIMKHVIMGYIKYFMLLFQIECTQKLHFMLKLSLLNIYYPHWMSSYNFNFHLDFKNEYTYLYILDRLIEDNV